MKRRRLHQSWSAQRPSAAARPRESDAPLTKDSAVSRQSDGIQPPLRTAASSDMAAISTHLSGGPQCLRGTNHTLSDQAPTPHLLRFEATALI